VLSPVNGFLATVALAGLTAKAWRQHRGVRTTRLRRTRHPSSPIGSAGHGAVRQRRLRVHRNPSLVV